MKSVSYGASLSLSSVSIMHSCMNRRLPFFKSSSQQSLSEDGPVVARSTQVTLDNPKHYLNTVSFTPTSPSHNGPPPPVFLHGYGAGLGFYFLNFPTLAQWVSKQGTPAYALDWLGMGRSARVPFRVKARRDDIEARVAEAESFFVDSLEQWRQRMGLEKMTLVGHSLGAYLSVVYALKYPTRVSKLVLLSPAGVPRDPNNTTMPSREVTDEQMSGSEGPEAATRRNVNEVRQEQAAQKRQESTRAKLFTYLWEEGWSPFQVVRSTLFWGPMLVGKVISVYPTFVFRLPVNHGHSQYSSRRFSALSEEETREMHDYIMNITLAKGSGEYCICKFQLRFSSHNSLARLVLTDISYH